MTTRQGPASNIFLKISGPVFQRTSLLRKRTSLSPCLAQEPSPTGPPTGISQSNGLLPSTDARLWYNPMSYLPTGGVTGTTKRGKHTPTKPTKPTPFTRNPLDSSLCSKAPVPHVQANLVRRKALLLLLLAELNGGPRFWLENSRKRLDYSALRGLTRVAQEAVPLCSETLTPCRGAVCRFVKSDPIRQASNETYCC